jgi:hypothetical protein
VHVHATASPVSAYFAVDVDAYDAALPVRVVGAPSGGAARKLLRFVKSLLARLERAGVLRDMRRARRTETRVRMGYVT